MVDRLSRLFRRRPMRWDRKDELDLADIGGDLHAATLYLLRHNAPIQRRLPQRGSAAELRWPSGRTAKVEL